jgi:putative glutamine amidotransferase
VINVALGGSLYADLDSQHPGALPHSRYPEKPRDYLAHPVDVSTGSCLAGMMGAGPRDVNSMHHQGIRDLAPGLQATALAPDGVIEAVELLGTRLPWQSSGTRSACWSTSRRGRFSRPLSMRVP